MKKYFLPVFIITLFSFSASEAQVIMRTGPSYGHRYRRIQPSQRRPQQKHSEFQPTLDLSIGYGYPNLDKNELVNFNGYYKGNVTQTGPITGALDYRFSRSMSIGVMVTHGEVSNPYYTYNNSGNTLNGSLDNWAFMFNLVRYMPVNNSAVTPYIRTAIGINTWKQNYTDANGSKINMNGDKPTDLAYQVGLGAQIKLSKGSGIFAEAGYGKYIVHGGLYFKF